MKAKSQKLKALSFIAALCSAFPLIAASPAATQAWVANHVTGQSVTNRASPAATQAWVKNYVETCGVSRAGGSLPEALTKPITTTTTNQNGQAVEIVLSFEEAKYNAMRVTWSGIDGLTNDTMFAEVGEYQYANWRNASCQSFAGTKEFLYYSHSGGRYEYVTNGATVVTNTVYAKTNEEYEVRYVMQVGETVYKSFQKIHGSPYYLFNTKGGVFWPHVYTLKECKVTKAIRDSILAQPVAFRWLDLLCPAAHAVTRYIEDTPDGKVSRAYTDDGDMNTLYIDKAEIRVENPDNPQGYDVLEVRIDYPVFDVEPGKPVADVMAEFNEGLAATTAEGLMQDVEGKIRDEYGDVLGAALVESLERSDLKDQLLDRLQEISDELNEQFRDCEDKPVEEDSTNPADKIEPVAGHECGPFTGRCGAWKCGVCGKVHENPDNEHPAEHSYAASDDSACQKCSVCGAKAPGDDESRHGGWHDEAIALGVLGTSHHCECECGGCKAPHVEGDAVSYEQDSVNERICNRIWQCDRCGESISTGGTFDSGLTVSPDVHAPSGEPSYSAVEEDGGAVCRKTLYCHHIEDGDDLGCGAEVVEDGNHDVTGEWCVKAHNAENHTLAYPCSHGFEGWDAANTNWCGYVVTNVESHAAGPEWGEWIDDFGHLLKGECGICTNEFVVAERESHVELSGLRKYKDVADEGRHEVSYYCKTCTNYYVVATNSCVASTNESDWALHDDKDYDEVACEKHGEDHKNKLRRDHAWTSVDEDNHECSNGGGHKSEPHEWDEDVFGYVCRKCGRRELEDKDDPLVCPDCSCTPVNCEYWGMGSVTCGCTWCKYMGSDSPASVVLCSCCYVRNLGTPGLKYRHNQSFPDGAAFAAPFSVEGTAATRSADASYGNGSIEGDVAIAAFVDWEGNPVASTNGYSGIDLQRPVPVVGIDAGTGSGLIGGARSITGPATLTNVADCGIAYITNLVSVSLPGARVFGEYALAGCPSLRSVSLPEAQQFGYDAFSGCASLTNVVLPKAEMFYPGAFSGCSSLESIVLPKAQYIYDYSFSGCTSLTNVVMPKAEYLGYVLFQSCNANSIHLHLAQPSVAVNDFDVAPAAIHFPSNRTLNGVSYPAETIEFGGYEIPIIWEAPYTD